MAFAEWRSEYSVSIPEIDEQHKTLFRLVSDLHHAVSNGFTNDLIGEIFERLIDYALDHFTLEEKYFTMHDYPGYQLHKEEHDKLTRQVLELQSSFLAGNVVISYETLDFLQNWLTDHILVKDKEFGNFLQERMKQSDSE